MATIKMRRLRANMPDEGRNIVLVWEDRGNPMKDSEGNIIYTDVLGQNGLLQCSQIPPKSMPQNRDSSLYDRTLKRGIQGNPKTLKQSFKKQLYYNDYVYS